MGPVVSFDHLIGGGKHHRRDGDAERLRGLQIDDKLEFGGLLHRQVGCLFAFENSAGVDAAQTSRLRNVASVTHQATDCGEFSKGANCRKRVVDRQCRQLCVVAAE